MELFNPGNNWDHNSNVQLPTLNGYIVIVMTTTTKPAMIGYASQIKGYRNYVLQYHIGTFAPQPLNRLDRISEDYYIAQDYTRKLSDNVPTDGKVELNTTEQSRVWIATVWLALPVDIVLDPEIKDDEFVFEANDMQYFSVNVGQLRATYDEALKTGYASFGPSSHRLYVNTQHNPWNMCITRTLYPIKEIATIWRGALTTNKLNYFWSLMPLPDSFFEFQNSQPFSMSTRDKRVKVAKFNIRKLFRRI